MSTWKIDPPPPGHRNPWCVRDEANDVVAIIPITTLRPAEQIAREIVAEHNAAQAGDEGTAARMRAALETIARGVWTAPNSIETIVYVARRALAHEPAAAGEPTA